MLIITFKAQRYSVIVSSETPTSAHNVDRSLRLLRTSPLITTVSIYKMSGTYENEK